MADLREVLKAYRWDADESDMAPSYVVCVVIDDMPRAYPFMDAIEAESLFRLNVSHGRAVTVTNLRSYHSFTIEGRINEGD